MLKLAGMLSLAIAGLHLIIIMIGGPAYRYFGAGEEMARLWAQGSASPALITFAVAIVFAIFAVYALSGAGFVRRLPLLRTGLVTIGAIYTLRGLLVLPGALAVLYGHPKAPPLRDLVFSLVVGTAKAWRRLCTQGSSPRRAGV